MFSNVGIGQLIIIFIIVMVLFGANRLPGLAKGLGSSIRIFKKSLSGEDDDSKKKD